ncbi:MAG: hypothetical protein QXM96_03625 [Candidatus Woesearchaeota archaeon]
MTKIITSKKAAIELSTGFIIGMIIGILMFSSGLVFLFKILKGTEINEGILPSNFDRLANECIENQKRVCLPEGTKNAKIGQTVTFGLVIYNNLGETKKFKPYVDFSIAQLNDQSVLETLTKKWTFESFREVELKDNEHYILKIPLKIPSGTKKGSYIFNVNICFDSTLNPSDKCKSPYGSLYDTTEQVIVNVI